MSCWRSQKTKTRAYGCPSIRSDVQPPATASEPEHVLLKPANLVSIGHVSAVRADFRARQAALEALIKPASGVELQIGGRGVDLEELRSRVDKARELIDLLPLVDDGVPLAEYEAVSFHRRVLGLSSDPPSGLRLRAFGQLKCSLLTLEGLAANYCGNVPEVVAKLQQWSMMQAKYSTSS